VETECNGLQTYDRAVAKIPADILLAANHGEISGPLMKVILADALFGRANWKYTMEKPADDWAKSNFDASAWKEGAGGFGTTGTPGGYPNTTWDTADIWLRRDFTLGLEDMTRLKLQIFHDEDAEVYLNGMLAAKLDGYTTDYDEVDISKESALALQPGHNSIAVHCHQTTGGQCIDVGILSPQLIKQPDKNEK